MKYKIIASAVFTVIVIATCAALGAIVNWIMPGDENESARILFLFILGVCLNGPVFMAYITIWDK